MQNPKQVENYILTVRKNHRYAAEAYSLCFCDTTGTLEDVVIRCIPEAKKGITGSRILLDVEKQAKLYGVSLTGHCTDSTSNSLSTLIKLASLLTFTKFSQQIHGLKNEELCIFCSHFKTSIAYPCWDHSGRTSVRNLMNEKIEIVAEVLPISKDSIQKYSLATTQDSKVLKSQNPSCKVRHADITPHVRQNCDAQ